MSDEVNETPLNWNSATNEARVLKNEALPIVSRAVKGTAEKNSDLEKKVAPLKETGFLEMSSQWLEQIEKNYPDYYDALMSRQEAISRLADTFVPGYARIWEGHGGMSPGRAKRRVKEITQAEWEEARKKAEQAATSTVDYIARTVNNEREKAKSGYILESDSNTLDRVNGAIKKEVDDGHMLHEFRIEARQIGALTEGVWATLNAVDQEQLIKPEFSLDIGKALQKQEAFDNSKAGGEVQPQESK